MPILKEIFDVVVETYAESFNWNFWELMVSEIEEYVIKMPDTNAVVLEMNEIRWTFLLHLFF